MGRVAVTGGSGKLGGACVVDLVEHGWDVVNLDRVASERSPSMFVPVDLLTRWCRHRANHSQRVSPKPLEHVLPAARPQGVGIIARVPLGQRTLSGKYAEDTRFAPDDHRNCNRHGGGVRCRRDLHRRSLCRRHRRSTRSDHSRPCGRDHGATGAALGHRPARCHHCDPRCSQAQQARANAAVAAIDPGSARGA